jgi:death-on-curing protein
VDEIISIHEQMLLKFGGGEEGIFQDGHGKLDQMISRMKEPYYNHQPFDSLEKKVAFLFQSILQYHPFVDGTKRTGLYSAISFLLLNDYGLRSKKKEIEIRFAIRVADEMPQEDPDKSFDEIVGWFRERMFKINDVNEILRIYGNSNITCPVCASEHATLKRPFCRDCGSQLIRHRLEFDGIVIRRSIELSRPSIRDLVKLNSPDAKFDWTVKEIPFNEQ